MVVCLSYNYRYTWEQHAIYLFKATRIYEKNDNLFGILEDTFLWELNT